MSLELIHASVEKGLRGGAGFGTAVATKGMPLPLERALEELSAYDFDPQRAVGADRVDWAHRVLTVQGRTYSVLSCTAPCGSDWSGRPNRVAHHIVVDAPERAEAGPAWMLASLSGGRASLATDVPRVEERIQGPVLPRGAAAPRPASAWTEAGFDPGWAGVVAQTLVDHPGSACYLVLPEATTTLPLLLDVFALLPDDRRWHVTFSTRFLRASAHARCQLRCVRAGAAGLRSLLAEPGVRSIVVETGVAADERAGASAGRAGVFVVAANRGSSRVQPVLRGAGPSSPDDDASAVRRPTPAAPFPHAAAADPFGAGAGGLAERQSMGDTLEPASAAGWDRSAAQTDPRRDGDGDGEGVLPYILFGVAGIALIASFILGVLIVLRQ